MRFQQWTLWSSHCCSGKESTCQCRRQGLISGSGRPPGVENGTYSSILAWKIPQTNVLGGIQSTESQRVRRDWAAEHVCVNIIVFINHLCQMFPGYSYIFSLPFECPWKLQQKFCFVLQVGGKKDNIIKYWVFHLHTSVQFSSVQSLSHVRLFATPWTAALQPSLSITNSQSLLRLMSIELAMPSNHLIFYCPLSSHLQSFPASRSFPMNQFFTSSDQNIGVSASTSVLPMNIHHWFPLGWTDWISLQSKRLSRISSNTTVQKHQFFCVQLSL